MVASLVPLPLGVAAGVAVVAGAVDAFRFRIPNLITVPFLVSGLAYHGLAGGREGLLHSAIGCAVCFLIVLTLYCMGAMGAGDVKFMAGMGAWLGLSTAVSVFFVAAMATAIYSLIVLLGNGGISRAMGAVNVVLCHIYRFKVVAKHLAGVESVEAIVQSSDRRRRLVPFAAMLALGVIAVIIWGTFYQS